MTSSPTICTLCTSHYLPEIMEQIIATLGDYTVQSLDPNQTNLIPTTKHTILITDNATFIPPAYEGLSIAVTPNNSGQATFHLIPPITIKNLKETTQKSLSLIENQLDIGLFILNLQTRQLTEKQNKKPIYLTEKECSVLICLYQAEKHFLTKKQLLKEVFDYNTSIDTHTLESHMYRLRKKTGDKLDIIGENGGYRLQIGS